jgi:hypothetical protein
VCVCMCMCACGCVRVCVRVRRTDRKPKDSKFPVFVVPKDILLPRGVWLTVQCERGVFFLGGVGRSPRDAAA